MGTVAAQADRETCAALALVSVPHFGPARIRNLIDALGSAERVLDAARDPRALFALHPNLASDPGLPRYEALLDRLQSVRPVTADHLRRLRSQDIRVVTYGTAAYPASLAHLHHPPPVLYLRGPAAVSQPAAVAIVGTRRATEYGRRLAGDIAGGLARAGHAVVSGLARGIDAAAHRACLAAGGVTIGVLGSGLAHRYPASSADLYRELPERGLLVSEFPPDVGPQAGLFPRRNRIIAGLASAVVVVQAGRRSGALITVAHALELGRDVFAVPGPVGTPASEGVHGLLRDGAAVATSADDVLAVVGTALGAASARSEDCGSEAECPAGTGGGESDSRNRILRLVEDGLTHVDALTLAVGLAPGRTLALLSMLELEGRVRALPGGRFVPST